jgi:hypothetical protein
MIKSRMKVMPAQLFPRVPQGGSVSQFKIYPEIQWAPGHDL